MVSECSHTVNLVSQKRVRAHLQGNVKNIGQTSGWPLYRGEGVFHCCAVFQGNSGVDSDVWPTNNTYWGIYYWRSTSSSLVGDGWLTSVWSKSSVMCSLILFGSILEWKYTFFPPKTISLNFWTLLLFTTDFLVFQATCLPTSTWLADQNRCWFSVKY